MSCNLNRLALIPLLACTLGIAHAQVRCFEVEQKKNDRNEFEVNQVFDYRNELHLKLSSALIAQKLKLDPANTGVANTNAAELIKSFGILQSQASSLTQEVKKIRSVQDVPSLASQLNALLGNQGELRDFVSSRFIPQQKAIDSYSQVLSLINQYATTKKAALETGVPVSVTVTHSRQKREGRDYPETIYAMLGLTSGDKTDLTEAAKNVDAKVEELKAAFAQGIKDLIKSDVEEPVNDLVDAARASGGEWKAKAESLHSKLNELLNGTYASDPTAAYEHAVALVAELQSTLNSFTLDSLKPKLDAAQEKVRTLLTTDLQKYFGNYLETLGIYVKAQEIAKKTVEEIIGESSDIALTAPKYPVAEQNGDTILIEVTGKNSENKETPLFKQEVHGYKIAGYQPLHTITTSFVPVRGSSKTHFTPNANYMFKSFTRKSLAANTWQSVGIGVSWFPVIDQDNSVTGTQQAFGLTASLLDDWFTVGYAYNMTTKKNFLYWGIQIKLGK